MSHFQSIFFSASAAVALVACSSSSGSAGTSGACTNYVAALRDGSAACGRASEAAPEREGELATRLTQACTIALNAPGAGITPAILDQCSAKVRAACGDDDACEDLASAGSLPDGAACGIDMQCAGGDCKTATTSASPCGTCASRAAVGSPCGDGIRCAKDAACERKSSGSTGTCVARVRLNEGDVCYDPAKPGSQPGECVEGLSCLLDDGDIKAPVKCTPRGNVGAPCSSETACVSELTCAAGTCQKPAANGTACATPSQCSSGACSRATRTCVAATFVAAGAACNENDVRCTRGSCSRPTDASGDSAKDGTCVDPIPDGAACTRVSAPGSAECDSFAECVNGTCQIFDPASCK